MVIIVLIIMILDNPASGPLKTSFMKLFNTPNNSKEPEPTLLKDKGANLKIESKYKTNK
jgi:hypothetical protein